MRSRCDDLLESQTTKGAPIDNTRVHPIQSMGKLVFIRFAQVLVVVSPLGVQTNANA